MDDHEPIMEEMEMENADEVLRDDNESVVDAFVRYQRIAAQEAKLALDALIPDDFKVHGKEAKRSFRKAFKVVLAELAARVEAAEAADTSEEDRPSTTGQTKVKIEVN